MNEHTIDALNAMRPRELRRVFERGHRFDIGEMADREYHGVSLGLPRIVERVTWKKFKKVFHRGDDSSIRGWNVRVEQNLIDEEWVDRTKDGRPVTYGHFSVRESAHGVLLDYSTGGGLLSRVRDPLVSLQSSSADRLLGFTKVQVLGRRVSTPSFFLLERGGPLRYDVAP